MEEAESRSRECQQKARAQAEDGEASVQALKIIRNREVKEARTAGVVLANDSEVYQWTAGELKRLRSELADEQATNKQEEAQNAKLQKSLDTVRVRVATKCVSTVVSVGCLL